MLELISRENSSELRKTHYGVYFLYESLLAMLKQLNYSESALPRQSSRLLANRIRLKRLMHCMGFIS